MDVVAIARDLARRHPNAKLPCPVCGASVNAPNLDRHLAAVHSGGGPGATSSWRGKGALGLFPCELTFDGDTLVFHHLLGLGHRRIRLPCSIEVGAMFGDRPDAVMSSYADELNVPVERVRTGCYLRLAGDAAVTIGCRSGTQFATHWERASWRRGSRRRTCDLTIDRTSLVALEYALAHRGLLVPASSP